jgi:hypothetical protein
LLQTLKRVVRREKRVKFTVYQADFQKTAMGYNPDAAYEKVWDGVLSGDVDRLNDLTPVLESIFVLLQRVDPDTGPWPPAGYNGRSLNVGDVVVIDGWAAYAVEPLGFKAVEFAA